MQGSISNIQLKSQEISSNKKYARCNTQYAMKSQGKNK